MTITTTGIDQGKVGVPVLDTAIADALDSGEYRARPGIVWLELVQVESFHGLAMPNRSADLRMKVERRAEVVSVGADCPAAIQRGCIAHYRRFKEFAGTDPLSLAVDAELSQLFRERDDAEDRRAAAQKNTDHAAVREHSDTMKRCDGRRDELAAERPFRRAWSGTNFKTRDGRVYIAVPWQCIEAVSQE